MSKHLKTYVGGQIKILRKQAALTQAELGEKIERTAEAIGTISRRTSSTN